LKIQRALAATLPSELEPATDESEPRLFDAPTHARLFPAEAFQGSAKTGKANATVSFRPHELRATDILGRAPEAPSFASAFARVVGDSAVSDLAAMITDKPVLLFAGDQLTGKSTLSKALARHIGGDTGVAAGTGAIVRKLASERGIAVEEMAKVLKDEPSTDVRIDYRACEMIAAGEVSTFESRLAGQLGAFLKSLGKSNVISVYLRCSPKERALRYIAREVSPEARARIEPLLDVPADADLRACLAVISSIEHDAAKKVAANFHEIAGRDDTDFERLRTLYGVDYRETSSFDLVLETTGKTLAELQAELESFVTRKTAIV
jgi:cytidylate kinase